MWALSGLDASGKYLMGTDIGVTLFSALKKTGVGDVAEVLRSWAASDELAQSLAAAHGLAAASAEGDGEDADRGDRDSDGEGQESHDEA